jgi:hypothetical protein
MFMVEVEMIFPPCYWSDEELADIPSEDLWCEIADCMFFPNTQDYVQQLQNELDRRKDQDHNQYNHKEY